MALAPGVRIGPYEVVGSLGAGGMGEVYRGRDARLGRDVALKILPDLFASDPERVARFEREAQVLASLNHQNIAAIYGLEGDGSSASPRALVMELVDGPTLAERIATGPIPLGDALPVAMQIAQALEAAHDLGIVHRDLKPANIKLRPDGSIKVLDFGLAKIAEPAAEASSPDAATYSPTVSLGATRAGMILGTAAYMSPEQARGRPVDKRADVWAFGAVLYEILTGSKAFPGDDISDTLATVIKFEPDWSRLPDDTPPSIRRLLKRCLTKDPKLRLRDCGSALIDIHDAQSGADSSADSASALGSSVPAPRRALLLPLVASLAVGLVAGAAIWALVSGSRPPAAPEITRRFTITLPDDLTLPVNQGTLVSLSPDGRTLIYSAAGKAGRQLYRRPIDQYDATAIPGTDDAGSVFFSPDGAWLGFQSGDLLRKLPLQGGHAQTLAKPGRGWRGAAWSTDGRILLGSSAAGVFGLSQFPETGGEGVGVYKVGPTQRMSYPQVLQGGRAVLVTLTGGAPGSTPGELHIVRLDTNEDRTIMTMADVGRLLPSGHLVFVRAGVLWAVPFDLERLEALGAPAPVVEGIRVESGGAVQYAVAADGTLVYIPGSASSGIERRLAFADADGRLVSLPATPREYMAVALSPDGTRVAVQAGNVDGDIWVVDITRGSSTRITSETGLDASPLWSLDGKSLVFASIREGRWTLNRRSADGTGSTERLLAFDGVAGVRPTSWSPDGRMLLMSVGEAIGAFTTGQEGWKPLIDTPAFESDAVVSPDGRWIAYTSNESGSAEVYVQRFPGLGDRRTISTGGGFSPAWSTDGRTLLYLIGAPPREITRVSFDAGSDGRVAIGPPQRYGDWSYFATRGGRRPYDVTQDGRILVVTNAVDNDPRPGSRQINVVLNWDEELRRLVPSR